MTKRGDHHHRKQPYIPSASQRPGTAEVPSDTEHLFLEMEAMAKTFIDRARLQPLHERAMHDLRKQLRREKRRFSSSASLMNDASFIAGGGKPSMPRHPPRKSLLNTTTTTTTNTTTTTTSSSPRPGTTQATRKGDAEIPSELDLFFLELDALFNAHQDRQQIDSLHAQILANMRDELARDATARRHSSVRQTSSPQQSDAVSTTESTTYTTVAEMQVSGIAPLSLARVRTVKMCLCVCSLQY
ncbi:hypothetical protein BJ741DRAFT_715227 [Chytriomyces cf. hyalinus JEL632]|nr:hypothetical protein BJ741DRAFT_715227 [Chytriomyces cf. hyalinus JEL632]